MKYKEFREEKGLTQQQFADTLKKKGYEVTRQNISSIEAGKRNPSFEWFRAVYREYGDINWVFASEDTKED